MPTVVVGRFYNSGRQWARGDIVPDKIMSAIPHHIQGLLFSQGALRFMDDESAQVFKAQVAQDDAVAKEMKKAQRIEKLHSKIADVQKLIDRDGYRLNEQKAVMTKLQAELIGLTSLETVETEEEGAAQPEESEPAPASDESEETEEEKPDKPKRGRFGRKGK